MSDSLNGLLFDVSQMQMAQVPGFVAPRLRVPYTDAKVQELLATAFEGQLPPLSLTPEGHAVYRWVENERDTCKISQPLNHPSQIPAAESMRLLQGWIKLRHLVTEGSVPEGVRSLLLNLRLPHPERAIMLYRLSSVHEDEPRIHILHGFENNETKTIPIEEAIALLLSIPTQQVAELAGQSQHTIGKPKPAGSSEASKSKRPSYPLAAFLLVLLLIGGITSWFVLRPRPQAKHSVTPAKTIVTAPASIPPAPASLPVTAAPPASPSVPSIDAMSVDQPKNTSNTPKLEGMIR